MIDFGHSGGLASRLGTLGVAVAAERVDHRPGHDHALHTGVLRRRSGRQRDRGIARIVRAHGDQHRQMAAARLARQADEVGPGLERARVGLGPAHRIVDVLHRGGIGSLVAGAEIERDRHDAVRGHEFVAQPLGGAVAHAPGAAMALDHGRKRPGAARLEDARQQRLVAVAQVLDIVDIELGGLGLEDCGVHGAFPSLSSCLMSPGSLAQIRRA